MPKANEIMLKKAISKQREEKGGEDAKKKSDAHHNNLVIKKRFKFNCQIIPIVMGNFGEIGQYIRLDHCRADQSNTSNNYK